MELQQPPKQEIQIVQQQQNQSDEQFFADMQKIVDNHQREVDLIKNSRLERIKVSEKETYNLHMSILASIEKQKNEYNSRNSNSTTNNNV